MKNYKVIVTGLWARIRWKQAGHSTQSLKHLLDVGRRLVTLSFIVVMLVMQDVFSNTIQPFGRRIQGHMEPALFHRTQELFLQSIQYRRECLRRLRVLLRVASLCRQHVDSEDVVNFVLAFSSHNVVGRGQGGVGCGVCGVASCALWRPHVANEMHKPSLPWGGMDSIFPSFFEHLQDMLGASHVFKGSKIEVPDDHDTSRRMFLGLP